ncbi:U1 snRNP-associated protein usp106 [Neolecta irregularis DAH-3]|uniref:U1 snRNP-associated protein usp106 n=1 Tax=Neolecta irregularis (strain DAH-3) TaxID=1198029 RepID=A0A1U7LNP1_NEOID|nr:U1 snRNP-associated protein usp106 [Neolecta irregularis DAH-3]|eukprot:OLL24275.1 U1 snRNP-associated protein usp106 [Neolecta irregularis DAH-3]
MAAEQRRMLEQLMGADAFGGKPSRENIAFFDPRVCKSFIVGTCPHDMFVNTKMDIGACPKLHSDKFKNEYEIAQKTKDYGFEWDYMRDLQKYVRECDQRIESSEKKLDYAPDEEAKSNTLLKEIGEIEKTIISQLEEVEVLGETGEVLKAIEEYHKVEKYKQDRTEKEKDLRGVTDNQNSSTQQKLQVCDICAAYLSRLDNDRRLADHFWGKLHMGHKIIRETYQQLSKELSKRTEPPRDYLKNVQYDDRPSRYDDDRGYQGGRGGRRGRPRGGRSSRY